VSVLSSSLATVPCPRPASLTTRAALLYGILSNLSRPCGAARRLGHA